MLFPTPNDTVNPEENQAEDKYLQWVKDLPIKQDRVGQSTVRFQMQTRPKPTTKQNPLGKRERPPK